MKTAKIISAAIIGLDARPIEVEVDISSGLHSFTIVGLADTAVQESKERVGSAVKNSGAVPPRQSHRLTVNLAPADLKKEGPAYDLPIAIGYLLASGQISFSPENKIFIGELALDGKIRPITGVLPIALMAKEKGFKALFVPEANAPEAALVEGLKIIPLKSLNQLMAHLEKRQLIGPYPFQSPERAFEKSEYPFDMAYIKGQEHAKRALEIAASGGHNVLLSGPPGAGKTLLARAIPSILPPITLAEALEATKIFSIAGKLPANSPLITTRPFRSPHHTASGAALVGGGSWPRPGEISLAHRGILFLDEFPEFQRPILESLRQPLEDGVITVSRSKGTITFPARFSLIAAMNPCPCGNLTDPERSCSCSPAAVTKYQRKISGPLLDRIDLHVEVPRLKYEKLTTEKVAEESASIRERVQKAREIQGRRFKNETTATNSEMTLGQMKEFCQIDEGGQQLLKSAVNQLHLSARAYHRILKISRTIADLAGQENIESSHLAEAIQYRPKE